MCRLKFISLSLLLCAGGMASLARAGDSAVSTFGFKSPEIFPIDFQVSQLHAADLDGDRLVDLIVVNNARSKINLLYNQTGKKAEDRKSIKPFKRELNELPPDSRFRIEAVASEKRIASLVVADLNGDGRPDLAYYGEPKELVVQYNQGSNTWSASKRWPITDGQLSPNMLTSGDLNGDGRTDLVLLAENHLYWLGQNADHTLAEPEKIPLSGTAISVQVLDIDGDGRDDLLLVNWENSNPFRFRLQTASGQLGPEIHFEMPPIRSYWADDLDGDHKTEVIMIAQNSGRSQIDNFIRRPAESLSGELKLGQLEVLPLNKTSKNRRALGRSDINRDGLPDLLVAEPDSAQLTVYLQQKSGALAAARTFSTLSGVSDLAVADWDADGTPEIFLLSTDERQVGITRMDANGRVPFPAILPVEGRPLALAAGKLQPTAKTALAVLLDLDGKRTLVTRWADGKTKTQKLSDNFKANPSSMVFHDLNQDGLADLAVVIPYEKIKCLIQVAGKDFDEQDIAPPGGSAEQPWLSGADIDGDGKAELLLAQKNFLRAVVLQSETGGAAATNKASWTFKVKEQINGAASNSRIIGAAAVPNGTNVALFLLDAERKALTLCERDAAGAWQVRRNISLPVTDFTGLEAVALGAVNRNSVAFLGVNAVAWMPLRGEVWELKELDSYETPIKDGRLNDVVSGDLNQDRRKDLVFLETAKNYLDLVIFDPSGRLVPANRWQVFEERTFRSRRSDAMEPREALIEDVTGDGRNDLVVLVHDRILVYPQE